MEVEENSAIDEERRINLREGIYHIISDKNILI